MSLLNRVPFPESRPSIGSAALVFALTVTACETSKPAAESRRQPSEALLLQSACEAAALMFLTNHQQTDVSENDLRECASRLAGRLQRSDDSIFSEMTKNGERLTPFADDGTRAEEKNVDLVWKLASRYPADVELQLVALAVTRALPAREANEEDKAHRFRENLAKETSEHLLAHHRDHVGVLAHHAGYYEGTGAVHDGLRFAKLCIERGDTERKTCRARYDRLVALATSPTCTLTSEIAVHVAYEAERPQTIRVDGFEKSLYRLRLPLFTESHLEREAKTSGNRITLSLTGMAPAVLREATKHNIGEHMIVLANGALVMDAIIAAEMITKSMQIDVDEKERNLLCAELTPNELPAEFRLTQ